MKFVKTNLDLIICGVIAIVALCVSYWVIGSWDKQTQDKAAQRVQLSNSALALIATRNKPIEIPSFAPNGAYEPMKLPDAKDKGDLTYEKNVIAAKKDAQDQMKSQSVAVEALASEKNSKNRVKIIKGARPNTDRYIPLMANGKPEEGFFPVRTTTPWQFKADYERQFPEWTAKLGYTSASKPLADEIKDRLAEATVELNKAAAGAVNAPGSNNSQGTLQLPLDKASHIKKAVISNRAASLRLYMDDNALPKRSWAAVAAIPPTEREMFDALVDTWLINDVVNAISGLNDSELAKQPSDMANVGKSPIKRLEALTIGGPDGMGNGLFVNMGGMSGGDRPPVGMPAAALTSVATNTVTGHVGTNEYDVILLNLKIIIDPAYLNKFIDHLYRQNNGYTVLNIKITPVDPLDAASNGYLYGDTQCVHAEIRAENIMFRTWTTPLMPETVRQALNISQTATPGR